MPHPLTVSFCLGRLICFSHNFTSTWLDSLKSLSSFNRVPFQPSCHHNVIIIQRSVISKLEGISTLMLLVRARSACIKKPAGCRGHAIHHLS
jgi:hypothetical protein